MGMIGGLKKIDGTGPLQRLLKTVQASTPLGRMGEVLL